MPIYDNNGSVNTEIGHVYDNNGSVNTAIRYVYDNNGTANTLIFIDNDFGSLTINFPSSVLTRYDSNAPVQISGGTYYYYSSTLDLRGFNSITFTVINNNARAYDNTIGNSYTTYSTDKWRVYAAGATDAFYASSTFGSSVTVSLSGLTDAQKNGIKFSIQFTWSYNRTMDTSTVVRSSGNWTISNIVAS